MAAFVGGSGTLRRLVGWDMSGHASAALPLCVTDVESWENEGGLPLRAVETAQRLDWVGFLARFYPEARRHDYESLAAYVKYRDDLEHAASGLDARGRQAPERSDP